MTPRRVGLWRRNRESRMCGCNSGWVYWLGQRYWDIPWTTVDRAKARISCQSSTCSSGKARVVCPANRFGLYKIQLSILLTSQCGHQSPSDFRQVYGPLVVDAFLIVNLNTRLALQDSLSLMPCMIDFGQLTFGRSILMIRCSYVWKRPAISCMIWLTFSRFWFWEEDVEEKEPIISR